MDLWLDKCRNNNTAFVEPFQYRGSSALRHCWKCKPIPQYRRCHHSSILVARRSLELAGTDIVTTDLRATQILAMIKRIFGGKKSHNVYQLSPIYKFEQERERIILIQQATKCQYTLKFCCLSY